MSMNGVRSYFTALRVAGRLGRATKLERAGQDEEALRVAREAMSLLRGPHIVRGSAGEASLLVILTVLIERLSVKLRQPGVREADLRESLDALEKLGDGGSPSVRQMRAEWIPFLQGRLRDAHET
jgi:hypothetical protein